MNVTVDIKPSLATYYYARLPLPGRKGHTWHQDNVDAAEALRPRLMEAICLAAGSQRKPTSLHVCVSAEGGKLVALAIACVLELQEECAREVCLSPDPTRQNPTPLE